MSSVAAPAAASVQASRERVQVSPGPAYSQPVTFHYEIQSPGAGPRRRQGLAKTLQANKLALATLLCLALGLLLGLLLQPYTKHWTERQFMYLELPGKLYLRLLKLLIIPVLVSNVILAFGSIRPRLSRHLAKLALPLYLASNLLAVSVAISLALLLQPGGSPPPSSSLPSQPPPQSPSQHPPTTNPSQPANQHQPRPPAPRPLPSGNPYAPPPGQPHWQSPRPRGEEYLLEPGEDPLKAHLEGRHYQRRSFGEPRDLREARGRSSVSSSRPPPQDLHQDLHEEAALSESNRIKEHRKVVLATGGGGARDPTPATAGHHELVQQQPLDHRLIRSTKLPIDVLIELLLNLAPDNLIGAALQQTRIRLYAPRGMTISANGSTEPPPSRWPLGHELVQQPNLVGLLAMSVLTGLILGRMQPASSRPLLELCACLAELSLRLALAAAKLMPLCIMFLLVGQVARARIDLASMTGDLFLYSLTMLLALLIHGLLLLPLLYYLIARKSPLHLLSAMGDALLFAFATSSSGAAMALMLNCLNTGAHKLNPAIVGAFGPLGAVFNMNGTAIYEAVGAIFIAQTLGTHLPLSSVLLLALVAALASFSTCGVPSSGLVSMVIVLNAINLPVLQLGLLYVVDFAIDRFRTALNVWSAAIVCALINHLSAKHLSAYEDEMKRKKSLDSAAAASRGSLASGAGHELASSPTSSPASLPAAAAASTQAEVEVLAKPKVISITITPPLENSHV